MRDKPSFSSERVLHKDYDSKGSVEKISGRESQELGTMKNERVKA
jgi:hypothetical protein